jgi:hypothetical protein
MFVESSRYAVMKRSIKAETSVLETIEPGFLSQPLKTPTFLRTIDLVLKSQYLVALDTVLRVCA